MSSLTEFLTVTGVFLVIVILSLLFARFLMWAILASMQLGLHRKDETAFATTPAKHLVKTNLSIRESFGDSHRR